MNTAILVSVALLQGNKALLLDVQSPEGQNSGRVGGHLSEKAVHDWFYNTHPALTPKGEGAFAAAQLASKQGEPLLLKETLNIFNITEDGDIFEFNFKQCATDFDKHADVLLDDRQGWAPLIRWFQLHRAGIPIVKFGWCEPVSQSRSDGSVGSKLVWHDFSHDMFGEKWRSAKQELHGRNHELHGRKFTGVMAGNENWGIFSLWHPNRTATWRLSIKKEQLHDIHSFLDDPSLIAFFHLQHSDVPHPKVISFPLAKFKTSWGNMKGNRLDSVSQTHLLSQYGSHWAYRRILFDQFQKRFGVDFHWGSSDGNRFTPAGYMDALTRTKFHAVPSGLGIDCYSIWESIVAGSIPVVERGFGMDSLLGQLPVLSVDSFADLSSEFLRAIHPYFLMHSSDFNWALLRKNTWLKGMRGSPKFFSYFVGFHLPPSPNTYLDSMVKPARCIADLMHCEDFLPDVTEDPQGKSIYPPRTCCAADPKQSSSNSTRLKVHDDDNAHPWAWGFRGDEELPDW